MVKIIGQEAVVISVVSGKGGVGKTVVSSNLAYLAARDFKLKTLLVDANITSSHLSSIMKIPTFFTLNRLLNGEKLDVSKLYVYDNILHVLPSKLFFGEREYSKIPNLKKIIRKLRNKYDVIVVDAAPGIGREALSAMEVANICLIVSTPFIPSLTDVIRVKEVVKEMGKIRLKLLLNMVEGKSYEINEEKVKYITGIPIVGILPFDEKVIDSVATGDLISRIYPNSTFTKALRAIAYKILSEEFYIEEKLNFWERLTLKLKGLLV